MAASASADCIVPYASTPSRRGQAATMNRIQSGLTRMLPPLSHAMLRTIPCFGIGGGPSAAVGERGASGTSGGGGGASIANRNYVSVPAPSGHGAIFPPCFLRLVALSPAH